MAQRQHKQFYTVSSETVQGPGSYVKFARPRYGEIVETSKIEDGTQRTIALMNLMVAAWDWVDDDGAALPLPKDDPTTWDRLVDEERIFLAENLVPGITRTDAKN